MGTKSGAEQIIDYHSMWWRWRQIILFYLVLSRNGLPCSSRDNQFNSTPEMEDAFYSLEPSRDMCPLYIPYRQRSCVQWRPLISFISMVYTKIIVSFCRSQLMPGSVFYEFKKHNKKSIYLRTIYLSFYRFLFIFTSLCGTSLICTNNRNIRIHDMMRICQSL